MFALPDGGHVSVSAILYHLCFDDEYHAGLEKACALTGRLANPALGDLADVPVPLALLPQALFRGASTLDSTQVDKAQTFVIHQNQLSHMFEA